ncbi:MAG: hypothetical protein ACRDHX_13750 [Chloroflexota bacterium]
MIIDLGRKKHQLPRAIGRGWWVLWMVNALKALSFAAFSWLVIGLDDRG